MVTGSHPSRREDARASKARAVWNVSCVAEKVIHGDDSSATLNLPATSKENISPVEDFVVEGEGLTHSEQDALPELTSPAPVPTQTMPEPEHSTPIIFDEGK